MTETLDKRGNVVRVSRVKDRLFGISVGILNRRMFMEKIDEIISTDQKEILFPFNTSSFCYFYSNPQYYKILQKGNIVYADGMSIVWAGRLFDIPIDERLATTDVIVYLFDYITLNNKSYRIFFLGGKEEVVSNAKSYFKSKYHRVNIVGHYSPPFMSLEEMDKGENEIICDMINSLSIDILFVGFGIPKQELWCKKNIDRLRVHIMLPCGGMFGYYGGEYKRAPKLIQNIGAEWLFRLIQEPKRLWKRYLIGNTVFIFLVLEELIKKYFHLDTKKNVESK